MLTELQEASVAKRRLILRDSLSILSLFAGTAVLFVVTLFLFRSFSAHRASLAVSWSQTGQAELRSGHPTEAIEALRTALSYAPGTRSYELLLAEALGQAGHIEESTQYFMGLWAVEPGNGLVNLQLARLAVRRNDRPAAINFYRASIYGTWEGDGVARRAEVRLELARYLIANRDLPAARLELLIAGGNAPDGFARDMDLAGLLEQAQDPADAWTYYQRAAAQRPDDPAAPEAAGRLAYNAGDYAGAERMLARARVQREESRTVTPFDFADRTMLEDTTRILELMPSRELPAREQAARALAVRAIAKRRFDACAARFAGQLPLPPALQALDARWIGPLATQNAAALLRDPSQQQATMQLAFDTEIEAAQLCGAPAGDDALLLRLATHPPVAALQSSAQPEAPRDGTQ
jgi:tetratricopeptide (TPR) repeat protein